MHRVAADAGECLAHHAMKPLRIHYSMEHEPVQRDRRVEMIRPSSTALE